MNKPLKSVLLWGQEKDYSLLGERDKSEYVLHLSELSQSIKEHYKYQTIKINKSAQKYLKLLTEKITGNNELTLPKIEYSFTIINHQLPFIFSLPGGHIFLSKKMIVDHLRNEDMFVAAVCLEMVRSSNLIYRPNMIIPLGYVEIERVLRLVRIPPDIKMDVNKLSYYSLRRSGYDPKTILSLIQTYNKNAHIFLPLYGERELLTYEELQFKQFLIETEEINKKERYHRKKDRQFYNFLDEVKVHKTFKKEMRI